MTYTEIKERNSRKYFYRVLSIRDNNKVNKKRIYLGVNLNKIELKRKESEGDKELRKESPSFKRIKFKIIKILKQYNVTKAGIFGSYARGDHKKNSDIDILIQPPKGMGLEFVGMQFKLEDKLKKKVHVVTYKYINPHIKKGILDDEVRII